MHAKDRNRAYVIADARFEANGRFRLDRPFHCKKFGEFILERLLLGFRLTQSIQSLILDLYLCRFKPATRVIDISFGSVGETDRKRGDAIVQHFGSTVPHFKVSV